MIKQYSSILLLLGVSFLYTNCVQAKMPDDPFVSQWAYEHTGAYEAWDYTVGSQDVVVAVIDNGIDMMHPDLEDNMWVNKDEIRDNGVDDDKNGFIDDYFGWDFLDNNNDPRPNVDNLTGLEREQNIPSHGTAVAGIIGAVGNNGLDGVGLNWKVKIMNLKVIGNSGEGGSFPLVPAIYYAVDNGANIINVSAVGPSTGGGLAEIRAAVEYAYKHNVLIVAAAGNGMQLLNENKMYPICADEGLSYQQVLGVSAMDVEHHLAPFSNVGSSCIDITAPGVNVSSTSRFSPTNGLMSRYVNGWSGTSFASPMVAGAAALIKSIQPKWGPGEISDALLKTVHHTRSQNEQEYAELFGNGLLQINKAIKYAVEQLKSKRPISEFFVWQSTKSGKREIITRVKYYVSGQILEKKTIKKTDVFKQSAKSVSGDFNKDGLDETAVWGDDPDNRIITVYNHEGKKMFIMYGFDSMVKGAKIEMLAGDVNSDGKDELIITAPGKPLSIWSLVPMQRVGEWDVGNSRGIKVRLAGN